MPIYTAGHSNHTPDGLFTLIAPFRITHIIDIRSVPYSGRFPYFNKDSLKELCEDRDLSYEWRGVVLGGIREDVESFEDIGKLKDFQKAIKSLVTEFSDAENDTTAVLICAERDPARCHRSMLIGPALLNAGVDLHHILSDGTLILQSVLSERMKAPKSDRSGTLSLFE